MTAADSPHGKVRPFPRAILLQRIDRVLRAGRFKPTLTAEKATEGRAVEVDEEDEETSEHRAGEHELLNPKSETNSKSKRGK
jgi:hypothetical protein